MNTYSRTTRWTTVLSMTAILATATFPVLAEPVPEGPVAVSDALHTAIASGDVESLQEILDPEVLIFESGGVESSLEEYASHHMHSDMKFMEEMEREVLDRNVFEAGNMAVVTTRSRLNGSFRDKELDLNSTETLVLARTDGVWKVRHIHWSSAAAN
ncbi:nuclear transport factor 2 family protein [Elongatibacter sediminis]|uniref:Nuclear transport factor 2 family protein n=1 Tax=Elongatibacter sediminis TaxID=3119006 RepID=A0AAW9RAR4_9GAMM